VDQSGTIHTEDLRTMLLKFADDEDESQGHVAELVAALDADESGKIDFEEFYSFGKRLERYVDTTAPSSGRRRKNREKHKDQLDHEVFRVIDKDRGGLVNIEELHDTIKAIGLDLSLNVVYNLVKDIDEDGALFAFLPLFEASSHSLEVSSQATAPSTSTNSRSSCPESTLPSKLPLLQLSTRLDSTMDDLSFFFFFFFFFFFSSSSSPPVAAQLREPVVVPGLPADRCA